MNRLPLLSSHAALLLALAQPAAAQAPRVVWAPAYDSADRTATPPGRTGGGPGAPDPTFGTDGVTTLDVPTLSAGLAFQPDGKILTGGRSGGDAAVFRFLPDGTLDASFGTGGVATADLGGPFDTFNAVAVLPDGRIVAAGYKPLEEVYPADGDGAALARFHPDGTLDPSFGTGGLVQEPGTPESDTPGAFWHVAVRPTGEVVAAGVRGPFATLQNEDIVCYAAQYRPDGSRDPSFGTDGLASLAPLAPEGNLSCLDGALMPDGRYVLGLSLEEGALGPPMYWGAARLLPDGTPDASFGTGGLALTAPEYSLQWGVAVGPDGAVTLSGWDYQKGVEPLVGQLARFAADGTLDAAFGTGGIAVLDVGDVGGQTFFVDVVLQSDGKALASGWYENGSAMLVRFLPDGTRDPSFGTSAYDGITFLNLTPSMPGFAVGQAIGLDAEGRIVTVGIASDDNFVTAFGYVARFENDVTVAAEPPAVPHRLALAVPAPNPTPGRTAVAFELAEAAPVRLALYDALGREAAVLAEGIRGAGTHEMMLDASRLAPGLYVVRLTAGRETAARRLAVVR